MDHVPTLDPPTPSPTRTDGAPPPLRRRRSVQIALAGWVAANAGVLLLSSGHLPFHAASLADVPASSAVLKTDAMVLEVFALMSLVHVLTRRRQVPDLAARAPARSRAARETGAVLAYGVLAMTGGYLLGHAFGWHAFGFHLDNMIIPTGQPVVPAEALSWAAYNCIAYALVPILVFRRRYTAQQLNLRSSNARADTMLVLVVLAVESAVQLLVTSPSILDLSPHQILLGAPLTFALGFAGTVLPTMVFVYCILTPRYLRLTGSVPATVILGGLTYALLHFFDGWTSLASPRDALLSLLYLVLFYTGPGMFKTFLTVRTGNAWVHVWAYHAIAPHTLIDSPMITRVFSIR